MDTSGYVTLSRQTGLAREMQNVANNIANSSTVGYRREGMVFAEHIEAVPVEGGGIALTTARVRFTSDAQGALEKTGGTFDLAIEGAGFMLLDTAAGLRLTRAGSFGPNAQGELVNSLGDRLLDGAEVPVIVPPDAASVAIAPDGTITANGQPIGELGLVQVSDPTTLFREDGVRFRADGPLLPVANPNLRQGFLEASNVNPVVEIARMIEVSRAYEAGQQLMEREDDRLRAATRLLGAISQQ
ncbi:MAG: flagellar hook-basal body complex protein [Pseudomonadota bacterium]